MIFLSVDLKLMMCVALPSKSMDMMSLAVEGKGAIFE
jgi:hypothetical protein